MKTAILGIIYNEHPYIQEWIEYHLQLGFDDIFLIEDYNSDSHAYLLQNYTEHVHLLNVDSFNPLCKHIFSVKCEHCFNKVINSLKGQYDWVLKLDVDEFLEFDEDISLESFLSEFTDVENVAIYCKTYGSNHHYHKPDCTVQEAYKNENNVAHVFLSDHEYKTFTNLNYEHPTITLFNKQIKLHNHKSTVNTLKQCVNCNRTLTYDKAHINHYYTKSLEEYQSRKRRKSSMKIFNLINKH